MITKPRPKPQLVGASLTTQGDGRLEVLLVNRQGHPHVFFISGVTPEVFVTLGGNSRHTANMTVDTKAGVVRVHSGDFDGDILADYQMVEPPDVVLQLGRVGPIRFTGEDDGI